MNAGKSEWELVNSEWGPRFPFTIRHSLFTNELFTV